MSDPKLHAVYSPSQLPRIMRCTASIHESKFAPIQESSSYANHGTMLHERVPRVWDKGKGQIIDLELEDQNYIVDCIDYLKNIIANIEGEYTIQFETKVDLSPFGLSEVWGTADVIIHDVARNILHVIDWKFGHGVQVYAHMNEQGLAYGAGAAGYPALIEDVYIHIVQPPKDHFDEFKISYEDLVKWVFNKLAPALAEAQSTTPRFAPGEKQCRWCPASMKCRARHADTVEKAQHVFKAVSATAQVRPEELAALIKKAEDIKKYISQLMTFAVEELKHGRAIPGYKLVSGRSNRKWKSEEDAEAWLENHSSVTEMRPPGKFFSPAQAEKQDRKLKKDADFQALIEKPPGKPQLTGINDKRPALPAEKSATTAFEPVSVEGGKEI